MNEEINRCFEDLAAAIVISAADDYKRSRFIIDTIDMRKYKDDTTKYAALNRAKREVIDAEIFFKSEWFKELSGMNGEKAFKALQETYVNEYYPMRMADERNGKSWFVIDK